MLNESKLLNLQNKLKYIFLNHNLLKVALTHKSYAYENKMIDPRQYNERLEYLGDAILEHIISELLYNQKPALTEGEMTKKRAAIVCEKTLASAIRDLNIEEYIYLGKCELITKGRLKDAILCDIFEAIIGAIYIDGGYEIAKTICIELLEKYIEDVLSGKDMLTDYKTKLQEKLQVKGNIKIEYKIIEEEGPDHDKTFLVEVVVENVSMARGSGKSKRKAEQMAAAAALDSLEK